MVSVTAYPHIVLDETGQARIAGTRIKVKHLVAERATSGWSPEEVVFQHPGLTLAQVFAALAYYEDNRPAIEAEIERDLASVERARASQPESPLAQRLRSLRRA